MPRIVQFNFVEDDKKYSYRIGIMIPKKRIKKIISKFHKNEQEAYLINPFFLFTNEINQLEKELLDLFSKNYDIEEQTIKDFLKSKNFYVSSFQKTENFYASNFNYDTHEINETPPDIVSFKNYDKTSYQILIDTINNLTTKTATVYYFKLFFRNKSAYCGPGTDNSLYDNGQLFLIKKDFYNYKIINQGFSVPCSNEDKQGIYSFSIANVKLNYYSFHDEINLETIHSETGYSSNVIPFTIPFSTYGDFRVEEFEILKNIETINNRKDIEKVIKLSKQNT